MLLSQTNLDNSRSPPLSLPLFSLWHCTRTHARTHTHAWRALECRTRNKRTSGWRERERESARRRRRREKDGCKARPGAGNLISPGCPAVVFFFFFSFLLPQHHFLTRLLPFKKKIQINSRIRPDVLLRLITILQGYAKRLLSRRRYFPLNARMYVNNFGGV